MISPSESQGLKRASPGPEDPAVASPAGAKRGSSAGRHPLGPFLRDVRALGSHFRYYLAARADAVAARIRKAVFWAVAGLVAGLAGLTVVLTGAVLLVVGVARALGALLGGHLWAGELITGVLVLTLTALALYLGVRKLLFASLRKTKENYERRREEQRTVFGADIHGRAEPREGT